MARECGRRRYWKEVREIADAEGVPVPEARRLWRERARDGASAVAGAAGRAVRAAISAIRVRPAESAPVCPYCRDDLPPDDGGAMGCPGCSARYHAECWDEVRCVVLGCRWQISREERTIRIVSRNSEVRSGPRLSVAWAIVLGVAAMSTIVFGVSVVLTALLQAF